MKILFNRNNSIGIFCLLLLLAVGAVSCIKDEYAENKEKATLTLYFTTTKSSNEASSNGTTIGPELPNEHMRTLRVIVVDKQGKIRYNTKVNVPENQTQTVINFSELIVDSEGETKFDVYAIANEEVYVTNNEWEGTNISLNDLKNKILDNIILSKLNEGIAKDKYEEGYAVPQTAIQEVTVTPGQENSATIPLEFVVAKVQLIVVNESETEQTLRNISLSNADVNKLQVPLFPSEQSVLSVGDKDVTMSNMTLQGYETSAQTAYVYENKAPTDGYVFNATWNGDSRPPVDLSSVENLPRGKELRITIHLKQNSTVEFNYKVLDWTNVEVDIPDFE